MQGLQEENYLWLANLGNTYSKRKPKAPVDFLARGKVTEMRLDRYLANMGCGSRKEVKQLIKAGRVQVNDSLVRSEEFQVEPVVDRVRCAEVEIRYTQYIYLMLNKPAGVVSATEDSKEQTVLDLLDRRYFHKGLFPVGRLDKDTEGLLLLTNYGELGHRLLAPKKHVPKRYIARISGEVTKADQTAFQQGIDIGDYRTLPGELIILQSGAESEVEVVIHEGKFHQIKRMFEARGKRVIYLKRVAMGELQLDPGLKTGTYRELTAEEIKIILAAVGLNETD